MADYIDKQKTLNVIFEIAENVINSLPSADVVEVVRCKDCKYYAPIENDYGICEDISGLGRWWKPDDYCSYGERNDD